MQLKDNIRYLIACILMLLVAFIQCYKIIHDLHWASEPDFDRDIAYIRSTLNGHYGQDPNYAGQYMWYNPLIFLSETLIVKISGLPINIVVARAGAFLNLINPIVFFIVIVKLFDYRIGLASLLSFIFLVSGNLPCWGAATYSPWLISDTFVQFIFYINIFLCYQAFTKQHMVWFIVLGVGLGISFLGHSAPTILVILIIISLQVQNVIKAIKEKQYTSIVTYILQGIFTLVPFIVAASPFLYYVYGKYHFHFINKIILECAPGVFARKETFELLKLNVTFSLFISLIGLIWFYRNFHQLLLRKIIWNWLFISTILFVYESVLPTIHRVYGINLPDTIPAFHYFFYLKALQSIFFGFGFIFLFNRAILLGEHLVKKKFSAQYSANLLIFVILLYVFVYFPIYKTRADFSDLRQQAIEKGNEKDKIDIYDFIEKKVPLNDVLLCEHGLSLFPVMPTGIKMVSVETYFSNPYISYDQREHDRNQMLSYLTSSVPVSAQKLFSDYKVNLILLQNKDFANYKYPAFAVNKVIYKNGSYTIVSIQ